MAHCGCPSKGGHVVITSGSEVGMGRCQQNQTMIRVIRTAAVGVVAVALVDGFLCFL